jgi:hypothetical protein
MPDPAWTTNSRPDPTTSKVLALVCSQCLVRQQCARYAFDRKLEAGTYAGVYVPTRFDAQRDGRLDEYQQARRQLLDIARHG